MSKKSFRGSDRERKIIYKGGNNMDQREIGTDKERKRERELN
jgi:hypothetical protein